MPRRVAIAATLLAAFALAIPASAGASPFSPPSACVDADPAGTTAISDDTTAPAGWWPSPEAITLAATGAAQMQWRIDCGARQTALPGDTISVSATDGTHSFSHRAIDSFGQATAWVDETIGIDSTAPTNTTSTPAAWSRPPVVVNVTGADSPAGVDHVEWNLDGQGVQSGPSGSSVTITGDGPHTLATQIVDAAGNRSPLRNDTVRIDGTAPTDQTVVPTGWQSTPPTITVTGSDALSGVGHVEWKLDGTLGSGANGATVTIPDGSHSFDTRIVDNAGNASAWTPHTVQVDVTGPQDTTSVPATWQTAPVTVYVTGTDNTSPIDHVEWKLDGNPGSGPNNSPVAVASDGIHTLETRIVNAVGEDSGWTTRYVKIDTLVPRDVTAAPSGWQTAPLTVQVTGADDTSATPDVSGIEHVSWQVDTNAIQSSTTNPNPIVISADGVHTLKTRTYDAAGLASGWKTQTVRIDTTAPVNSTPVGSSAWRAGNYSVVLAGGDSTSGLAEMRWQVDGGPVEADPPGTQISVTGTGAHTLTTWAVDVAGNASGPRNDPINIDTLPPTDTTSVPATLANHGTVAVTGTDAHSGINHVEWRVDGGAVNSTATAKLDGNGTHTLETQVVDNAGNLSGWTSHTVAVFTPDTTAPTDTTTTVDPAAWNTGDVTVTVSAGDADSGVRTLEWRLDGTGVHSATTPTTLTISGDGVHELETRATDNAGNTSTWRVQEIQIDTTLPVDTTALPTAGWSNSRTLALSGTDATSGVGQIQYKLDGATSPSVVPGSGTVSLPSDGQHTIAHRVIDNAGQATPWKTDTVKVDTVKPVDTTPAAPTAWQTAALHLALSGTDDRSGIDHYEWRIDGGTAQTGTQTDVTTDGTHTLETRAVDAAGNASDWRSQTIKVDTTPPTNTTATPAAAWQKTAPYTVTVSGTDATSGLDHVEWRLDGGAVQRTTSVTVSANGAHALETRVVDLAGNASAWRSDSIGIDPAVPTLTAGCGSTTWQAQPAVCTVNADGGASGLGTFTVTRGTSGTPEDLTAPGTYTVAEDGEWTLNFRAVDGAGNAATATALVRVDRTPPQAGVSCTPDSGTAYTCQITATDGKSGVAKLAYSLNGGAPQYLQGAAFSVAKGTVVVSAVDAAGNVGSSAPLALADRTPPPPAPAPAAKAPAPKATPNPRSRATAIMASGSGAAARRLLGQLTLASLPSSTTVDLRPLALVPGRYRLSLTVKVDKKTKTVRRSLKLQRDGHSGRIVVRLGGAFHVSAKLEIRRRVGARWVRYARGSATLS